MTKLQENRLSMYLSFKDFQAAYTAITKALPNYSTNSTAFLNTIPAIQLIAEQQKTSKKGFTDLKNTYKETLITTAADYARKLGVYAKFTNNAILVQEIKFSQSKISKATDTAIRDYAQIVYDRAQANLTALEDYGISEATQTILSGVISDYNESIGKPRANRTEISKTTRELENLFKTADTALANMDAAVEIVRLTQAEFYISYKNARKIIGTGGALAIKGSVIDASNNKPIKGVSLSFFPENNNGLAKATGTTTESVVKKTAEKGGFNIKSLPSGMYTVAVKKTGYADQVATVAIADGELTELNIQLSKN